MVVPDTPSPADRLATLKRRRDNLKVYLFSKAEEEDWHGVQDAASDLRDIDSAIEVLKDLMME